MKISIPCWYTNCIHRACQFFEVSKVGNNLGYRYFGTCTLHAAQIARMVDKNGSPVSAQISRALYLERKIITDLHQS